MLIFYTVPVSNFCTKVEIVLRLKGTPFRSLEPPGGYGSEAYRALVWTGTVPALLDADLVLAESEAILEYLEQAYPEPALLPGDARARARARELARYHDSRLEPPLRALFGQMSPALREETVIEARLGEYAQRLAALASRKEAGPWLLGDRLTLADCAYPGTLLMAEMMHAALGRPHPLPVPLASWLARLRAHPAVAPVLAAQAEATTAWLKGKGAL